MRGALHAPASHLKASPAALDAVLAAAASAGATTIVVHCALSQVRGPACAARLAERLAESGGGGGVSGASAPPAVEVLRGGFGAWADEVGVADAWTDAPGRCV